MRQLKEATEKILREVLPQNLKDEIEKLFARGLSRLSVTTLLTGMIRKAGGATHCITELAVLQYLDDRERSAGAG